MKLAIDNAFQFYFINNQLKLKNEELKKTNEELNRFAYSASHDLKAPVKSMQGLLNLAKIEGIKNDKLLQLFDDSIKRLDYFINNIIDYYKNTRSEKTLNEINFNEIISDSLKIIEETHNCSISDINVLISIKQETPFINDNFRLHVIISYLLSNAIKYQKTDSNNKEITIGIEVAEKNVKIKITDNGIGISGEHQEHIYKMFYRGTSQSTGSGIGLYIVKETLEKIEGKIIVRSTENEGTSFEIEIPNEIIR